MLGNQTGVLVCIDPRLVCFEQMGTNGLKCPLAFKAVQVVPNDATYDFSSQGIGSLLAKRSIDKIENVDTTVAGLKLTRTHLCVLAKGRENRN